MNIVDHRILIPASPDQVWEYISDIQRNPEWQIDCKGVMFLTTMRNGPGTRWRVTMANRREMILEVTAWYDRIGYEYRIVDGGNFRENKGILRLQEIAEGTVVQWTFSYLPSGVLGGLANAMTTKRRIENEIAESLRGLYRQLQRKTNAIQPLEVKSLMRDAPDVEARANYKPRHPSIFEDRPEPVSPIEPIRLDPMPAVEDDTRPNVVPQTQPEPDFLQNLPMTPAAPLPKIDADEIFRPPRIIQDEPALPTEVATIPMVQLPVDPDPVPLTPTVESLPLPLAQIAPVELSLPTQPTPTVSFTPTQPTPTVNADTTVKSVFEIFGLQKPSETGEMRAVPPVTPPTPLPPIDSTPPMTIKAEKSTGEWFSSRIGLRLKHRRQNSKVRLP